MTSPAVLLIHRDLPFHGGISRAFANFASARDRDRLRLHAASLMAPSPEMESELTRLEIPVHSLGDRGYLRPAAALRGLVKSHGIDLVVCSSLKSYLVAKLALIGLRCGVVFWIHGVPKVIEGRAKQAVFRVAARRDPLLFISHAVRARHGYPGHRGRSSVVYYGVEDPALRQELQPYPRSYRETLDIPVDAVVLGYVAEFIDWKDHPTLVAAFSRLSVERPDLYLLLIGTGRREREVRELAASLPGGDRIRFTGSRTDARRLLGVMDVYVHVSRGEGFGLAVAEAMLAGLPVIASDEGALPELVAHRDTGILSRAGEVDELVRNIGDAVDDVQLRQRLGDRARAAALQRFSPDRYADELTAFFEASTPPADDKPLWRR